MSRATQTSFWSVPGWVRVKIIGFGYPPVILLPQRQVFHAQGSTDIFVECAKVKIINQLLKTSKKRHVLLCLG
jgi:hypothetical protein